MAAAFSDSELMITPDKRMYHINLRGEDIADTVLLVGDPDRVHQISKHFTKIDCKTRHREFVTHTGFYNGKRLTVLSTGIGVDNIDIVLTELDAAVNIDLDKRELLPQRRTLTIVRLGTCGGLQADLPVGTLVASAYGIGMDGLLNFYDNLHTVNEDDVSRAFIEHMNWPDTLPYPYAIKATDSLLRLFADVAVCGITGTAVGFYGPQGRKLRLAPALADMNERLTAFRYHNQRFLNLEMETSALYGMASLLGHDHLTVCVVIANRLAKQFSPDLHKSIEHLIVTALDRLTA